MSMTLTDQAAAVFTFPANFKVSGYSWIKKNRIVTVAYRDGGDETGDNKLDTRVIQVEGILRDNTTFLASMATMNSWLYKGNLKLSLDGSTHINVKLISDVNFSFFDGGFNRIARVSFSCICPDPYFYADALTTVTKNVNADPYGFNLTNASLFDVLPIIEIVNGANNFNLTLTNTTDGSKIMSYIDPAFLNGQTLRIDSKLGTVSIAGINKIQYFSGNFLRLLAGVQSFVYTGAINTMNIYYYNLAI
jgi:hypothetical protein